MKCFEQTATYAKNKKSVEFTDGKKKYSSKELPFTVKSEKMSNLIELINLGYAKVRKAPNSRSGVEISLTQKGRDIKKILESMKKP